MSIRPIATALIAAGLALALPAHAHESGGSNRGTIERLTPTALVVKTPDGHLVVYGLGPDTRFERGGTPVAREDAKVGERVVVEGTGKGNELSASRVKLPPAGAPAGNDHGQ